jgi:RNA polymerase sigma-32 factor
LSRDEVEAIAGQLNVKPEEVTEMETRLGGRDVSVEPLADDDESAFAPIAYLTNDDDEPGKILEHEQSERVRAQGLETALAALDPRSRRIIESRWLREGDTATLHQLADEFDVSAERIRQIEGQAMKKMRSLMLQSA